jgi:hypothetical protein
MSFQCKWHQFPFQRPNALPEIRHHKQVENLAMTVPANPGRNTKEMPGNMGQGGGGLRGE